MNELLYFIIARDNGRTIQFPLSCKKLIISGICSLILLTVITVLACTSIGAKDENHSLHNKMSKLESQLQQSQKEQLALSDKLHELQSREKQQSIEFKEEKEQLLATTVSELQERSELMEEAMRGVGIKVEKILPPIKANSGGPYIALPESSYDKMIQQADSYLNKFSTIPLGRPIKGKITSRYGKRSDPFNNNSAYHSGVDIRGKRGEPIFAPADGVVLRAFVNAGYGRYVEINHGNGYKTAYGHMKKIAVKKGQKISRGDIVGFVGNSGRSTGPHLHYEVIHNNKTVNPYKFMAVRIPTKKGKNVQ